MYNAVSYVVTQDFVVYGTSDVRATTGIFSTEERSYIDIVRYTLRDQNPLKYYSLNPMLDPENQGEYLTDRQDYLWDDYELWLSLMDAVAEINLTPPVTSYSLSDLPSQYRSVLVELARGEALMRKAINWASQEYSYNVANHTLDLTNKSDRFQALAESIKTRAQERLVDGKRGREKVSIYATNTNRYKRI